MGRDPMRCPRCGVAMNHHADKLVYADGPDAAGVDPALGGRVEEAHSCPACGANASRPADGP